MKNHKKGDLVIVEFEKAEVKDIYKNNEGKKIMEIVFEDGFVDYYPEDEIQEYNKECKQ